MIPDGDRPVRRALHNRALTAESAGVSLIVKGSPMASKAPADGHYTTTDEAGRTHQFKVRKGDVYPPDAEFVAAEQATEDTDAKPTAKEQQAKRGPSETTAKAGANETS